MSPSVAEQIYEELWGRIDDSWLLHKSLSRSDKAGNLQYPLDLIEASKRLLETSKSLKDTDARGVLGVLDRYLPPYFSGFHHSSSHAGKLATDISDIAVYDDRNILECWRARRRERKPQGHKPDLNAPCVLRWLFVGNVHLELKVRAALY